MNNTVFQSLLASGAISGVAIVRAQARKGKPAMREGGGGLVWVVRVSIGEREMFLEAARGGAREWASLDKLLQWLAMSGVIANEMKVHAEFSASLQKDLEFALN